MRLNLRPVRCSVHRLAAFATAVVLGVATASASSQIQTPPFPTQPVCYAPPAPELDGWPVAPVTGGSAGLSPGITEGWRREL